MPKFEKIAYKPIPVRDLLTEMKNLSELMIDLAYSAALFNDKELAEVVLDLEQRIDTLAYLLDIDVMVAARGDPRDAEALIGVSTVAAATDKISDAAADIAGIVTHGIGVHPIRSRHFFPSDDIGITISDCPGLDGGGIGTAVRLRESTTVALLHVDQRGKPLVLNFLGQMSQLHSKDRVLGGIAVVEVNPGKLFAEDADRYCIDFLSTVFSRDV